MTSEDFKRHVRDGVDEIFNKKNLGYIDEFVAHDIVDHAAPPGLPPGIAGYRMKVGAFIEAFPDLEITYEHQVAEGDMIAGRFTLTGTQRGEFAGVPATGKAVRVTGHDHLRFEDGKLAEHWVEMDVLTLMQQLGAL